MTDIQRKIQAYLASDTQLKESAQRAFQSYLKSVYLLKNKHVFDVFKLDTDAFANSLGLAVPPRVRFLQRQLKIKGAPATSDGQESKQQQVKPKNVSRLVSDSEGKASYRQATKCVSIFSPTYLTTVHIFCYF